MVTACCTIVEEICDQKYVSSKQWPYNLTSIFISELSEIDQRHQTQWHLWTSHYPLWNYCTIYSSIHTHYVYMHSHAHTYTNTLHTCCNR